MPSSTTSIISSCTIRPSLTSMAKPLKLSASDLPMLSCQYIQKGVLLSRSPLPIDDFILILKRSLAATLSHFPILAGQLTTDARGHVYVVCNDTGIEFVQAKATHLVVSKIQSAVHVHECFKEFFALDHTVSCSGHSKPLAAVQVTELDDGVFVGCSMNHAVADGTSFWHFFNSFAEICRGAKKISKLPDFSRNTAFNSSSVLKLPIGGPRITFSSHLRRSERIFHFSVESILHLKSRANHSSKLIDEVQHDENGSPLLAAGATISSFQSLCAQTWRSVTRARNLSPSKKTTFRMAANCRHRLNPRLDPYYFGNAIQSIATVALAGDLLSQDLHWIAGLLHNSIVVHDDSAVRSSIQDWERKPRLFPLGNSDGASITIGSSPRFPMYDNDFGWGRPLAVRSGTSNKFDGKISAFPAREGGGAVDLEVVLSPETMSELESDVEFMHYVSSTA